MLSAKGIILCADDFGLSPGICEAILTLARENRLNALSCMVNGPSFLDYAPSLKTLSGVHIGLHFNLTDLSPLGAPTRCGFSLPSLLLLTHLRLIQKAFVRQELEAQLDRFIQVMGRVPDFIDGHQHVHQFPVIRDVVMEVYHSKLRDSKTYVRATFPNIALKPYGLKGQILAYTGGRALQQLLKKNSIAHNSYFGGVYDFSADVDYRGLFQAWYSKAQGQTLIMCHPGHWDDSDDPIAKARVVEMAYFSSDAFLSDIKA